ncbi:hypothetical protein HDU98_005557 [Podochytrium sp. JEL0797]|nr:hypothetical protein HDU98_005557 [Podochytrium sp. JEL0797]
MLSNPLPQDVTKSCRNAAKIITQFIVPTANGIDQIIPPQIIAQAKGIAILSVFKAGFLFSGRGGTGLVVARLDDGSWSAPSAIGTVGFGAGGQIGAEITDFVIILNTIEAVKAFSHGGNVTLGGNLSIAAGPIGRNVEAAGSVLNFAPIYSYSVTKGLFVGISLEGSVIMERKDTNAAFYRRKVTAKEILSGGVPPPPAAEELYRALNRRTEQEVDNTFSTGSAPRPQGGGMTNPFSRKDKDSSSTYSRESAERRDPPYGGNSGVYRTPTTSSLPSPEYTRPAPPLSGRLPAPAPPAGPRVRALYDYEGQRDGDLSFRAGDEIVLVREDGDWWTGRMGRNEGVFPFNYVERV